MAPKAQDPRWVGWASAGAASAGTPVPGTPADYDRVYPADSDDEEEVRKGLGQVEVAVAAETGGVTEASGVDPGERSLSVDAGATDAPMDSAAVAADIEYGPEVPWGPGKEFAFACEYYLMQSDARKAAAAAEREKNPPAPRPTHPDDPFAAMVEDGETEQHKKREVAASSSAEPEVGRALRQEEKRARLPAPQGEKRVRDVAEDEEAEPLENAAISSASPKAQFAYHQLGDAEVDTPFPLLAAPSVEPLVQVRDRLAPEDRREEQSAVGAPSSPRVALTGPNTMRRIGPKGELRQRWTDMGDPVERLEGVGPLDESVIVPLGAPVPLVTKEEWDQAVAPWKTFGMCSRFPPESSPSMWTSLWTHRRMLRLFVCWQ